MHRPMSEDTGLKILLALCIPGLILSAYLSYGHYRIREMTESGTVCPANTEGWACNDVLLSEYSEILGVPVAVIGLIGIIMILVISLWRFLAMDMRSTRFHPLLLCVLTTGGLGVTSWLTYIEFFVIHKLCPYCFSVFIITILLEVVAIIIYAPVVGKVLRGDMVADGSCEYEGERKGQSRKGMEKKKNKDGPNKVEKKGRARDS